MRKTRRARKLRTHKQRGGVLTEGTFKFDNGYTWKGKWNGNWRGNTWTGDAIEDPPSSSRSFFGYFNGIIWN